MRRLTNLWLHSRSFLGFASGSRATRAALIALVVATLLATRVNAATVAMKRERVVHRALRQVGKPYSYGADGPGSYDCSGLVEYAYRAIGVRLAHWTYAQIRRGVRAHGRLRPGDLLFFRHGAHVGLYVGHGRYVAAPHTGARVRVRRLDRSSVYEARRIIH